MLISPNKKMHESNGNGYFSEEKPGGMNWDTLLLRSLPGSNNQRGQSRWSTWSGSRTGSVAS